MELPLYQVDAFTRHAFAGNPAAICPLLEWIDDALMQRIAAENNLSETAFFAPVSGGYALRWFTPATEVELCGHATLASAHILYTELGHEGTIAFETASGTLHVTQDGGRITMDFPALPPAPCTPDPNLFNGLRAEPDEVLAAVCYLAVFSSEDDVRALTPDFAALSAIDRFGVIATAPGTRSDFVSRFFAPAKGVPEDPVTGSAHCTLTPYWSKRLGKTKLHGRQISARGGDVYCEDRGDRVSLGGYAVTVIRGTFHVND